MILVILSFVLLFGAFSGTTVSSAPGNFPVTPWPGSCRAEPRDLADLIAIAEDEAGPSRESVPDLTGDPVSEEVAAAVEDTLIKVFACLNAGDHLRAYSLYTDDYLRRILAGQSAESLQVLATPTALDKDELTTILAVEDVRLLSDGRVYAVVRLDPALIPVDKTFGFFLVEEDDRWLVDDVLDELEFSLPSL